METAEGKGARHSAFLFRNSISHSGKNAIVECTMDYENGEPNDEGRTRPECFLCRRNANSRTTHAILPSPFELGRSH